MPPRPVVGDSFGETSANLGGKKRTLLCEKFAEGFFYHADFDNVNIVTFLVDGSGVIFRDEDFLETEAVSFGNTLFRRGAFTAETASAIVPLSIPIAFAAETAIMTF